MFLSLILSLLNRTQRFSWKPALDMKDHVVYSTLIPGAQY